MRIWAMWRRMLYGGSFLLVLFGIGLFSYYGFFFQPANCFDEKRNGNESGVDCGGGCVRICAVDVIAPQIIWSQSFEINEGQYNAVAYVENPNQIAATPEQPYTFELFSNGQLIAERSGTTILPPNSVYPIFAGRIFTDSDLPVTETKLTLPTAELWLPASVSREQFRSIDIDLQDADSQPRLDVEIENTTLLEATDVEIVATIFNEGGDPVTASQTFIEEIGPRSTEEIVFTWPNSIARTVRSCVVPTDVALVIDLSGSMNNDGEEPPQPLTAAVGAASTFASSLAVKDQISVITFASDARMDKTLSSDHASAAETITALSIDPAEETGFTNTTAALVLAKNELNSPAHNDDARRVIVLLTDGLPTAAGNIDAVTLAVEEAQTIDADDIQIYAIGLGQSVDRDFIQGIASTPESAFFAPSGDDLAAIYATITGALCESGPTKIDVIAKTRTNFAPLR